jgi:hypothetical protein
MVGLSEISLNRWAKDGWIVPKVRGRRGRGWKTGNIWSAQQALGLAVIGALKTRVYAPGQGLIADIMQAAERTWTDAEVEEWLGPKDAWEEEADSIKSMAFDICPGNMHPALEERLERVCEAIHDRLCRRAGIDRITPPSDLRGLGSERMAPRRRGVEKGS